MWECSLHPLVCSIHDVRLLCFCWRHCVTSEGSHYNCMNVLSVCTHSLHMPSAQHSSSWRSTFCKSLLIISTHLWLLSIRSITWRKQMEWMNFEPIVSVGCSMHNLTVCAPCQVADVKQSVSFTRQADTPCVHCVQAATLVSTQCI